ncbi:tail fiber domain-containing protein [Ulvibacter litoralis]|uniref:Head domain of trimeric autotransporter adhesin n=1 Tax=Ulvibacter litoralis TaxID=227084 RepID=A0A1G7HZ42_9FLAO|nr:tail fiber domain-containing protein [Ulvibacter litoralis]GHC63043.1 hypothetical protein GCM10008083_30450 [Ulvibacter litoralis]SDF05573.1 Head domain of trimeric autotransporter adhesin [Ulvibacter litoralis]
MKTKLTLLTLLFSVIVFAQSGINYKAIVKDGSNNILANQMIDVQFIIYEGAAGTNNVYQESHTTNTDANGMVILTIGEGTTSDVFTNIEWETDEHWLNVQIDTGAGLTDLGTTQFMAVPYALHATNVSGLEAMNEGSGIGWRLLSRNQNNYGNIGFSAIDFSYVSDPNLGLGATGDYSFSLGHNGTASGEHSLVFGDQNYSFSDFAIAMGNNNIVSGVNATAIGAINQVPGNYAFAVGLQNQATENYTMALGNNAVASGEYGISVGRSTISSGIGAIAMGSFTEASGDFSVAIGSESEAQEYGSIAIGDHATATRLNAIAMGRDATATNQDAVALGYNNRAAHSYALATGSSTVASGLASFSSGFESEASGPYSVAMGRLSLASGNNSFSFGEDSWANNNHAVAIGENVSAQGENSTALGFSSNATGSQSVAIGRGLTAQGAGQVVVGSFNEVIGTYPNPSGTPYSNDPVFIVASGGNDEYRRNSLTVLYNNNVGIGTSTPEERLHVVGTVRIGTETIEDTGSNQLSFNASLLPDGDNLMRLGNSSNRWIGVWAVDGTINTSDRRDKENITDINYGLAEIEKLTPVRFNWKQRPEAGMKLGLIAQDIQKIIPEVVMDREIIYSEDDPTSYKTKSLDRLGVYYSDLIPVLIKAIQEQQNIIHSQKSEILRHTSEIDILSEVNKNQDERMQQLSEEILKLKERTNRINQLETKQY